MIQALLAPAVFFVTSCVLINGKMLEVLRSKCEELLLQELAHLSKTYTGMSQDTVCICFETEYVLGNCARVAITGSLPQLGSWDPSKCAVATMHPPGSNNWRVCINVPRKTTFTWKWIVVASNMSKVWRWEEREDRITTSGNLNGRWMTPWNGSAVFTPERPPDASDGGAGARRNKELPLHMSGSAPSTFERLKRTFCTIL